MRYFTQEQLIRASEIAEQRGYNRQLNTEMLVRHTKQTDRFEVWFAMPHEHAAGMRVPLHIRCMVLIPGGGHHQIDTDLDLFKQLQELEEQA